MTATGTMTDLTLSPAPVTGPCAKQTVRATIVTIDGETFVGENDCENPQTVCPRAGLPTGTGYELCKSICRQTGHAEINAIRKAGALARGATLYLEGHTYACNDCKAAASRAGIASIIIGLPTQPQPAPVTPPLVPGHNK